MTDAAFDAREVFSVRDLTVVVTGASGNLGARFARLLHANGALVIGTGRRADRLDSLRAELPDFVGLPLDITDPDDVERFAAELSAEHGPIDVLVNNAGGGNPSTPAETESLDRFRAVVDLNLTATFHLTQRLAVGMLDRGQGSIINLASVLGLVASAPRANASYDAAKGAVVQLTRELGCQWSDRGVRVNAIAPGFFPPEAAPPNPDFAAFVDANCPMRRTGRPGELDGALLYLASPASSYVTGQVLVVDGGWTAR